MTLHKNYYRQILLNVRKIVKCGICGHRVRIEFHHIKPTKLNGDSRGSAMRAYDIIKHPDCYIPLCYFCHQKVTSGKIEIHEPFVSFSTVCDFFMYWHKKDEIGKGVKINVI